MRLFLALLLISSGAMAQGLPGSETVILRLDSESIYAHRVKAQALEHVKSFLRQTLLR